MYVNSIEERNCMNVQYLNSYHTQVIFKTNCFTLICSQRGKGLSTPTLSRDEDPFWDPVEPLLLGTAHLWLQSLAFRIPLEEQLEVHVLRQKDHFYLD